MVCTAMRPRGERRRHTIREPAADRRAGHARELHEERRGQAGHRQSHVEPVVKKLRHPRQQHDGDEVRAHERAEQAQQRRRAPDEPEEARRSPSAGAPSRVRRCARGSAAPRAGSTRNRVSTNPSSTPSPPNTTNDQPPAVGFGDQSGEEAAADRAHVHRRLVEAERARARRAAVIVADERRRRRKVERLAEPFGRAKQKEMPEVARHARSPADDAPGMQAAEDRPSCVARGRRRCRPAARPSPYTHAKPGPEQPELRPASGASRVRAAERPRRSPGDRRS